MCFSNLPVEFDEDGDPYLAEAADDVSDPGSCVHAPAADCGCGSGVSDDTPLGDVDHEEAFAEILDAVSDASRTHLSETGDGGNERRPAPPTSDSGLDSAEGD